MNLVQCKNVEKTVRDVAEIMQVFAVIGDGFIGACELFNINRPQIIVDLFHILLVQSSFIHQEPG